MFTVSIFSGGVSNFGTLSAAAASIQIGVIGETVTSFAGNVFNSGTITATTGIGIAGNG